MNMYNGLSDQKYLAPLCENISEAKEFLNVENSLFKIVADLENIKGML